jgi:hypothetical protein
LLPDVSDAIATERELHQEYRRRHLDRPPLNAQSGRSD